MEFLKLTINGSGFTDVTGQITPTLSKWAHDGQISGDALCCVTMATAGAGLVVTSVNPGGVAVVSGISVGSVHVAMDYSGLRDLFARTSEIFLVRGPTIMGGRRIYVLSSTAGGSCEVALTLL